MIGRSVQTLADRYDPTAVDPPLQARVRLVAGDEAHDALVDAGGARIVAAGRDEPDAVISGPPSAWQRAANGHGGLAALGDGIRMRHNLHVATGFLAATAGGGATRLRLAIVDTPHGPIATAQAGSGPLLLAVHGLGGTKASFLPTLALMSRTHRVVAIDLPGFGDSVKPLRAAYDARYFARVLSDLLDALGAEHAHLVGNSMGGRIALELALSEPSRVDRLVLLAPAMAWLKRRRWAPVVRLLRPELTLLPLPAAERVIRRLVPGDDDWTAAGVDEFLRAFSTPRGRHAFHAVLRNIYLDAPHGDDGLWSRLAEMQHDALFVWGRRDSLVPIAFMKHVERTFPAARHLELDCGHVPQVERPFVTHDAMRSFLS